LKKAVEAKKARDETLEKEEDEKKKEELEKLPCPTDKFKNLIKYLTEFVRFRTSFFNFIHIYAVAFTSSDISSIFTTVSPIALKVIEILKSYSKLRDFKEEDKLNFDGTDNSLETLIRQNLVEILIGFIGKTAGCLMKFSKPSKDKTPTTEEKMQQTLLESKLFSGGIENRFVRIFSKNSQKTLSELVLITKDKKIEEFLNNHETSEEDTILNAVIHQGQDPEVDLLMDLLQHNLMRSGCIWAKAANEVIEFTAGQ